MMASEKMEFEKAIEYRELLKQCKTRWPRSRKSPASGREDRDIVAMAKSHDEDVVVQVFFIREGKYDRQGPFLYIQVGNRQRRKERSLSGFVKQFYAGTPFIPQRSVGAGGPLKTRRSSASWLISQKRGQKVKLVVPQERRVKSSWLSWPSKKCQRWCCHRTRKRSNGKSCVPLAP